MVYMTITLKICKIRYYLYYALFNSLYINYLSPNYYNVLYLIYYRVVVIINLFQCQCQCMNSDHDSHKIMLASDYSS